MKKSSRFAGRRSPGTRKVEKANSVLGDAGLGRSHQRRYTALKVEEVIGHEDAYRADSAMSNGKHGITVDRITERSERTEQGIKIVDNAAFQSLKSGIGHVRRESHPHMQDEADYRYSTEAQLERTKLSGSQRQTKMRKYDSVASKPDKIYRAVDAHNNIINPTNGGSVAAGELISPKRNVGASYQVGDRSPTQRSKRTSAAAPDLLDNSMTKGSLNKDSDSQAHINGTNRRRQLLVQNKYENTYLKTTTTSLSKDLKVKEQHASDLGPQIHFNNSFMENRGSGPLETYDQVAKMGSPRAVPESTRARLGRDLYDADEPDVISRLTSKGSAVAAISPLMKPGKHSAKPSMTNLHKVSYGPGASGIKKSRMVRARSGGASRTKDKGNKTMQAVGSSDLLKPSIRESSEQRMQRQALAEHAKKHMTELTIEIENLQGNIAGLETKLGTVNDLGGEITLLRKELRTNESGRDKLRKDLEAAAQSLKENQLKNEKFQKLLQEENKNLNRMMQEKDQTICSRENTIRQKEQTILDREREIKELTLQLKYMESTKDQNEQLKKEAQKAHEQREKLQREFEQALKSHAMKLEQEYQARQNLMTDKKELQDQIQRMQKQIDDLKLVIDKKDMDISQRDSEISRQAGQLITFRDIQQQRDQLHNEVRQEQENRMDLASEIEKIKREAESLREKDRRHVQQLNGEIEQVQYEREELHTTVADRESKIKNLMGVNLELQSEIKELHQILDVKDDLEQELRDCKNMIEELKEQKAQLQTELDNAGDYILDQEERVNKSNLTAYELLQQLKEADEQLEQLKKKVQQLQSLTAVYVPVKGDAVDMALADYLNNIADKSKLQVMFIRLNPGVYSFGSKKVCIKVDNGKINIRVGGGYLRIEEFLEKYTTIELEKSLREGIDPQGGQDSPLRNKVPMHKEPPVQHQSTPASPLKRSEKLKQLEILHGIDKRMPSNVSPLPRDLEGSSRSPEGRRQMI